MFLFLRGTLVRCCYCKLLRAVFFSDSNLLYKELLIRSSVYGAPEVIKVFEGVRLLLDKVTSY